MFRRLLFGLLTGAVVGALLAAALVDGLKVQTFDAAGGWLAAYGAAVVAGALAGLLTGKPFWAKDAKTEAGLKAFFGALMAAGAMFALQRWGSAWVVDLRPLGAGGPAPIAELPAASLPAIAAVLGALFGLDNTEDSKGAATQPGDRARAGSTVRRRVEAAPLPRDDEEHGEEEASENRAKRSTR